MQSPIKQIITIVAYDDGEGLRVVSTSTPGPAKSLHEAISILIDAFMECGDYELLALGAMMASNTRMAIECMVKARVKNARDSSSTDESEDVENARDSSSE